MKRVEDMTIEELQDEYNVLEAHAEHDGSNRLFNRVSKLQGELNKRINEELDFTEEEENETVETG